jgi:KaiC/GvpD/RAD55 family RecA-like ATPase
LTYVDKRVQKRHDERWIEVRIETGRTSLENNMKKYPLN